MIDLLLPTFGNGTLAAVGWDKGKTGCFQIRGVCFSFGYVLQTENAAGKFTVL